MKNPPLNTTQAEQLLEIVSSLGIIRDSLVTISLALSDFRTDRPSRERDEVMAEVQLYLSRFSAPLR